MKTNRYIKRSYLYTLVALCVFHLPGTATFAQSVNLSKNADFSTEDRDFTRDDILYMRVSDPSVDFTDIDKNEYQLSTEQENIDDIEGSFDNLLNGTYEASLDLSVVDPSVSQWDWRARIEDDSGHEFRPRIPVQIGAGTAAEISVAGELESVGSGFLVVASTTIAVDSATIYLEDSGQAIAFTDLRVNDLLSVRAQDTNNALRALVVTRTFASREEQFTGVIESLAADRLVVLGREFLVDAGTTVLDLSGNPILFSQLVIGTTVEVKAEVQPDGTFRSTRIKVEDAGSEEIQFTGVVTALSDTSVTVDSVFFLVTDSTIVEDINDNPAILSDLDLNFRVEVRGEKKSDGIFRATTIKVEDDGSGVEPIEVSGAVTAVGPDSIVVQGLTFGVDAQTSVLDDNGDALLFAAIRVGFIVEIRATPQADGSFLATRIKVEDFNAEEVEVSGAIESIGVNSIVVLQREFLVTDSTVILGDDDNPIDFSVLRVGDVAEVRGEVQLDSSLLATRIKLEDLFIDEVGLVGTIESLGPDSLVVSGVTFFVTASTLIQDLNEQSIALSALSVGSFVEVEADIQASGQFVAVKIEEEDRIGDEVSVTGIIEELASGSLTVLSQTFGVTENTVVFDRDLNITSLAALFLGQTVEVRGDLLPDGTLVAIRIRIEDSQSSQTEVTGPVDFVGQTSVRIIGVTFDVDANTEILDVKNQPIPLTDLKVGQIVEVEAQSASGGDPLASRIKVENVLLLSAVIDEIAFNGIQMAGVEVLVDARTLILGTLNRFITVDSLIQGQFIQIRGLRNGGNTVFATKVRFLGQGVITSVGDEPEPVGQVPEDFALLRNFPNPFNPATTIRFRVPGKPGEQLQTTVSIYNLLGQTVRTLVNSRLAAGVTHARVWDGRDDRGATVGTGVYIYRLKAGEFSQTRQMALIK